MFTWRRVFIGGVAAMLVCGVSLRLVADVPTSYVYKTVDGLDIHADVYVADGGERRPVVVWIHGGALIMGHRASVPQRVRQFCRQSNYILVSIDYRLAPETKLPEIISDVEDAFAWIQQQGSELFAADVSRIAVMGGSAGGYLTLSAGYRVQAPPRVLLAFWGYGDLIGPWYSTPSTHARHHRTSMSKEEAWQQVSGPPISDARQRRGNGSAFYQYCRQTGTWPRAVSTWDPAAEGAKFHEYMPLKNVSSRYPPTFLIHGTADTDVPFEQSVMMADQFRIHGVEHVLGRVEGGEHGLGGGDAQRIADVYREAFAFVKQKLAP